MLFFTVMRVEKQLVPVCREHLCNNIFVEHSFVQAESVFKNLPVDFFFHKLVLIKRMAEQKPRVAKIALDVATVFVHRKPHIRVGAQKALV